MNWIKQILAWQLQITISWNKGQNFFFLISFVPLGSQGLWMFLTNCAESFDVRVFLVLPFIICDQLFQTIISLQHY